MKVAFQGERGAFSEAAAYAVLGAKLELIPCHTFSEMFEAVAKKRADCAVSPIENSLVGSIHQNYDLLSTHGFEIVGETYLRIVHNLIAPPKVKLKDIKRVTSHPMALAQCEKFFKRHPGMTPVPAYDTAGSVKQMMTGVERDIAAIAGATAAKEYGGAVLVKGIEDNPLNFTRFLVLARPDRAKGIAGKRSPKTAYKTSLAFPVPGKPGALFGILAAFALRNIDLTKIESRPIEGKPWEYRFYVDVTGHRDDRVMKKALDHLEEMAGSVSIFGSYPASQPQPLPVNRRRL